MIRYTLQQIADICQGQVVTGDSDTCINGVAIDTRKLTGGELFVALPGARTDGHEHLDAALASGATAALVNVVQHSELAQVQVDDTQQALGLLAAAWRCTFDLPVIAVTGSNGKTTVTQMLARVLRQVTADVDQVLVTQGNYNNELGVPLTLCGLHDQHRYAVIEMGAGQAGDIDYLARMARPDVGIITQIGSAHLQRLKNEQGVALAKSELFSRLPNAGVAIFPADSAQVEVLQAAARHCHRCEVKQSDAATAGASLQPYCHWYTDKTSANTRFLTPAGEIQATLRVPGAHNASNAACVVAAAQAVGLENQQICTGLEQFKGVSGRLQRLVGVNNCIVLDDTYNANPNSLEAALKTLSEDFDTGSRWLVLGDMGELGSHSEQLHNDAGKLAARYQLERLYASGTLSRHSCTGFGEQSRFFDDMDDLIASLQDDLHADVVVLVKGSRAARMERVVAAITVDECYREAC